MLQTTQLQTLSKALKRYMTASIGSMRKSNFRHNAFSCSKFGRWIVSPARGMGVTAFFEDEIDDVTFRSFFAISGSLAVDMVVTGCRR